MHWVPICERTKLMTLASRVSFIALTVAVGILSTCGQTASAASFTFTSFRYPGTRISGANGINNSGQVVGFAAEPPALSVDPAGFLYDAGSFTPIVFPGSTTTEATGINNNGVVVGNSSAGAFTESGGTYTLLGISGRANGINDLGQIVGSSGSQGFLDNGGVVQSIVFPGATTTSANGVNNLGQIVGDYSLGVHTFGFLDDAGTFTSLSVPGSLATVALGINQLGEIVGYSTNPLGFHGFVYVNGAFQSFDVPDALSLPEGSVTWASGINDFGEITGSWQSSAAGQEFAFVATPVPEPGTLVLLATGIIGAAGAWRRQWLS